MKVCLKPDELLISLKMGYFQVVDIFEHIYEGLENVFIPVFTLVCLIFRASNHCCPNNGYIAVIQETVLQ